jgi:hypothetical protein
MVATSDRKKKKDLAKSKTVDLYDVGHLIRIDVIDEAMTAD